jgi:hypothetical protein
MAKHLVFVMTSIGITLLVLPPFTATAALQCYRCDSNADPDCTYTNIGSNQKAAEWLTTCPGKDDQCSMSYTVNMETLDKLTIKRDCITDQQLATYIEK